MSMLRRFAAVSTITVLSFAAACGSDDGPTAPTATAVIGVTTEAMSSTSVKISFTSHAGDNSYNIERAEGASGTFSQVTSVPAPTTAGTVTYTDNSLKAATLYRYRVVTVLGSSTAPSNESSANPARRQQKSPIDRRRS